MKIIRLYLPLFLIIAGFLACKKNYDSEPITTAADRYEITIQEQYETPPSRVSVFFKVEDRNGTPVAGLTEEHFTIYEKGRNDEEPRLISADEATRVISDNRQVFRYNSILLLDLSGSVLNNSLEQLKTAANAFVDDVMNTQHNSPAKIGVWWFDGADALHPLIDFTENAEALHQAIDGINSGLSNDSSTDLFGAVLKSTSLAESKLLENQLQDILTAVSIVVFTDGTDQAARYAKEDAYMAVAEASEGISFYAIGLGNEIDEKVLKQIGKTSFVFADDTAALTLKFEEIAQLIGAEANSFYLFEYCTPKRDGSGFNDLHIVINRGNAEGRKVTVFDATGFENDCDLN